MFRVAFFAGGKCGNGIYYDRRICSQAIKKQRLFVAKPQSGNDMKYEQRALKKIKAPTVDLMPEAPDNNKNEISFSSEF